ncbi:glycosyltransferase [Spirillospora sp. NPDC047279]|uniref:glycosyltransferase n=1 Tax=Spirillospora sp. NPDC047279 TaxID=3155478 RepID=UPI0033F583F0
MSTPHSRQTDRHVVTAVLVAHDGARWLPETLKSLLTQTRPVQRLVAVDTGSRDRGPAVLAEVVGAGNVLTLPRTTGYGQALADALGHPAASIPVPDDSPGEPRTEWVWLLHDDSAPAHDALALLLRVADSDPNATVLGAKLRDWNDRRVLLELGVTIDGAGRRETGLDRSEFDQGQHDGIKDVLAVSSAGMLVRRDVWERLGGFDTGFGLFRDDLDFCWRALAAGHRVVAVSDAVLFHAEASRRGVRDGALAAEPVRRRDRRNVLFTMLANLPWLPAARALVRNVWSTFVRVLFLMLVKQQQAAKDELGALGDVLKSPRRLLRMRAARSEGRRHVYHSVKRYRARWVAARYAFEMLGAYVAARNAAGRRHDDEDAPVPDKPSVVRRLLAHPGLVLVLVLTFITVAAERSLLTAGGTLGGGALVPAWDGAGTLWSQYVSGWHPVGLGSDAGSPPYVAVLALLSTLTFGKPWLAVSLLLLGSVPMAGLTAYLAARLVIPDEARPGRRSRRAGPRIPVPYVRAWFAAVYALLPAATGAIAGGRLGTAVVIVLLPLIAVQVARMYGLPRGGVSADPVLRHKRSARAAWMVALLLTVAMAFVPLVWPLALIGGALTWVLFEGRSGRGRGRRNLVIALATPPLLLLPWTVGMLLHPSRFLLEAGPHVAATPLATAQDLISLNPGGPGTPARWTMYALLVIALTALVLRGRRTAVLAGWMLAIFGGMTAILVSMATVAKGADEAPAWPGVALVFAAAGVLLAATAVVQRGVELLAGKHLTYQAGGALVVLAALSVPLVAAGAWVARGAGDPLGKVDPDVIPAFVTAPTGPRTLVMRREASGRVTYTLVRGQRPMLGESETPVNDGARRRLDGFVAGLAGGRVGDSQALTRMGVQYVLVPRPGRDALTGVLDANPELTRLSRTRDFGTWRLPAAAGRIILLDGGTATPLPSGAVGTTITVPAGTRPRTLLVAEPADGGWRAAFNGAEVPGKTVDGWAQGYELPAAGGQFELSRGMLTRQLWVGLQAAAFLLVVALALPGVQLEGQPSQSGHARRGRGRRARVTAGSLARRPEALRHRPTHPEPPDPTQAPPPDPTPALETGLGLGRGTRSETGREAEPAGSGREPGTGRESELERPREAGSGTEPGTGRESGPWAGHESEPASEAGRGSAPEPSREAELEAGRGFGRGIGRRARRDAERTADRDAEQVPEPRAGSGSVPGASRGTEPESGRGPGRRGRRGADRDADRDAEQVPEFGAGPGSEPESGREAESESGRGRRGRRGAGRGAGRDAEQSSESGAGRGARRRKGRDAERDAEQDSEAGASRGVGRGAWRSAEHEAEQIPEPGADPAERDGGRGFGLGFRRGTDRGTRRSGEHRAPRSTDRGAGRRTDRGAGPGGERGADPTDERSGEPRTDGGAEPGAVRRGERRADHSGEHEARPGSGSTAERGTGSGEHVAGHGSGHTAERRPDESGEYTAEYGSGAAAERDAGSGEHVAGRGSGRTAERRPDGGGEYAAGYGSGAAAEGGAGSGEHAAGYGSGRGAEGRSDSSGGYVTGYGSGAGGEGGVGSGGYVVGRGSERDAAGSGEHAAEDDGGRRAESGSGLGAVRGALRGLKRRVARRADRGDEGDAERSAEREGGPESASESSGAAAGAGSSAEERS